MSASASVAVTTAPTFVPEALFSATLRISVAFANTGGVLTAAVELLVTAGTPPCPVVKEAASLPAASWMALASSPLVGSV